MSVTLSGVGSAIPAHLVDNSAFDALGLTDRWIVSRTGIRRRHRLAEGESLLDLAEQASAGALREAGLRAGELDFVVAATLTHDLVSPGLGTMLAGRLGTAKIGAVDVNGACSGFVYAMDYAISKIESGRARTVLVCGADANSRIVDHDDPATAPLFGDAVGAVVLTSAPDCTRRCRPVVHLAADGSLSGILRVERSDRVVKMDGVQVYSLAIDAMADALSRVCKEAGLSASELDLVIPHQANLRIIQQVALELGIGLEHVSTTVEEHGNTSAASIPVALAHARDTGALHPGATIAMAAFGAGLSWGALLTSWQGCRHTRK